MTTRRQIGKYRLLAELGHGGMADVFLAMVAGPTGSGFAKLAVLKRLRPNLVEDPEFVAMLMDEARVTARLNHPNVVQLLEVGVDDGEYFLAMEYLDGQPLYRIEKRAEREKKRLAPDVRYLIVADTLRGLHYAHTLEDYTGEALGIVHRDVTPQNVFVTYDGQVKVLDFGIAVAEGRSSATRPGIVKGKVRYMSPEQAMGARVDARADIFAAGVLLWEAATGRRMWQGVEELGIVQALLSGSYEPSPRAISSDVPEAIDIICRTALARAPEDRYESAAAMLADLETVIGPNVVKLRRELVQLTATLFAADRARVKGILEEVGKASVSSVSVSALLGNAASNSSSTSGAIQISTVSLVPTAVSVAPAVVTAASITPSANVVPVVAQPEAPAAPRWSTKRLVLLAPLAAALVAAVVGSVMNDREGVVTARSPSVVVTDVARLSLASEGLGRHRPEPAIDTSPASPVPPPVVVPTPAPPPPASAPSTRPASPPALSAQSASPSTRENRRSKPKIDLQDPWTQK